MTNCRGSGISIPDGAIAVVLPPAIGDSLMAIPAIWLLIKLEPEIPKVLFCDAATVPLFGQFQLPKTSIISSATEHVSEGGAMLEWVFDFKCAGDSEWLYSNIVARRRARHLFGGLMDGHHYEIDGHPRAALSFAPGWEHASNQPDEPFWAMDAGLVCHALNLGAPSKKLLAGAFREFLAAQQWTPHAESNEVVLVPGGGAPQKRWVEERWVELGHRLAEQGLDVTVSLGPEDRDPLPRGVPHERLSGLDLGSLSRRFQDSALVVANDCGPMHIAAIMGCNLLALFGPTNERIWFPYEYPRQRVIRSGHSNLDRNGALLERSVWPQWPSSVDVVGHVEQILSKKG